MGGTELTGLLISRDRGVAQKSFKSFYLEWLLFYFIYLFSCSFYFFPLSHFLPVYLTCCPLLFSSLFLFFLSLRSSFYCLQLCLIISFYFMPFLLTYSHFVFVLIYFMYMSILLFFSSKLVFLVYSCFWCMMTLPAYPVKDFGSTPVVFLNVL